MKTHSMNYSKRRQPRNNLEEGNPPNNFHFPDEKIAPSQFNISSSTASTASTECPFLMHRFKTGRKCDCSNCIDPNQLSNVRAEPSRHRIGELLMNLLLSSGEISTLDCWINLSG
jgi:hypothetical protein